MYAICGKQIYVDYILSFCVGVKSDAIPNYELQGICIIVLNL